TARRAGRSRWGSGRSGALLLPPVGDRDVTAKMQRLREAAAALLALQWLAVASATRRRRRLAAVGRHDLVADLGQEAVEVVDELPFAGGQGLALGEKRSDGLRETADHMGS